MLTLVYYDYMCIENTRMTNNVLYKSKLCQGYCLRHVTCSLLHIHRKKEKQKKKESIKDGNTI